ncbi:hypothetical protein EG68_07378 [Paragonimus skrjabini miyazakii]|uniref:Carboxypeptidase n=1 Tax=Paragonimus skrjabini miyazakii TaxID=59628 RepID=A0A8S9YNP8_9TREM|nr:hypothetical protein EG68_07378 [Paragonimus skrjabini miyazakii]
MRFLIFFVIANSLADNLFKWSKEDEHNSEDNNAADDKITFLPGLRIQPSFAQFSGFLRGSDDNFQLHYWFVEAVEKPSESPLVVWLNGGPGCSSLEGLLEENGPFRVQAGQKLIPNPHSWNKFANVLYLEAPAGVGYSFAKDGNVTTDDDLTSLNSYHALLHFMEKFPDYKNHDLFIFGESYGGVYVPTLALRILENSPKELNLRGIAVGNPLTSYKLNDNSLIYFLNYHGLVDESLWNDVLNSCCGSQCANKCMFTDDEDIPCQNVINSVQNVLSGLNVYNLYSKCAGGVPDEFAKIGSTPNWESKGFAKRPDVANLFRNNIFVKTLSKAHPSLNRLILPCVDDSRITSYLNQPDVRKALHVNFRFLPEWEVCSEKVYNTYERTYKDVSRQYLHILEHKIPVMLFAGDIDMACNYLGLLWFVDNLGLQMTKPMEHWLFEDTDGTKQVGGVHKIMTTTEGIPLWYVTVRGSGHMVPEDKPIAAYHMITRFISRKEL